MPLGALVINILCKILLNIIDFGMMDSFNKIVFICNKFGTFALSASLRENHAEGSTWKVLNLVFFHHNSML